MRIIAGKWRGASLIPPPGHHTRPILDHVKEALFNILGSRLAAPGELPPVAVLDLFAGTGSLGLEALSRGASSCTFVESHRGTAEKLYQNIEKLRVVEQADVWVTDAWKLQPHKLNASQPFELVFVDPPYSDTLEFNNATPVNRLLEALGGLTGNPAADSGVLLCLRHAKRSKCTEATFRACQLVDQRTYGGMTISFLTGNH